MQLTHKFCAHYTSQADVGRRQNYAKVTDFCVRNGMTFEGDQAPVEHERRDETTLPASAEMFIKLYTTTCRL